LTGAILLRQQSEKKMTNKKIELPSTQGIKRKSRAVHFTDSEWQQAKEGAIARGISTRSGYIRQMIHEDRARTAKKGGR
jgi:hypothetical protein